MRFRRSLNYDLIEETTFESEQQYRNLLLKYLVYYNHKRPLQSLGGILAAEFLKKQPEFLYNYSNDIF